MVVLLARAYGFASERIDATEAFEPAFAAALVRAQSTLLHLVLDTEVITSRTTIAAIRANALEQQSAS